MALESPAELRDDKNGEPSRRSDEKEHGGNREQRRHHHHHHRSSRHRDDGEDRDRHGHRHKRSRHSREGGEDEGEERRKRRHRHHRHRSPRDEAPTREDEAEEAEEEGDEWVEKAATTTPPPAEPKLKRDDWMQGPSGIEIDYTQRGRHKPPSPPKAQYRPDFDLKIHKNELNPHLADLASGKEGISSIAALKPQHEVGYTFGDTGSQWRMTKLKAVYTQSQDTGRSVEDIAVERFGGLRAFDDAREEQVELERRETYGKGYVGKEKPSGELFEERRLDMGIHRNDNLTVEDSHSGDEEDSHLPTQQGKVVDSGMASGTPMDQTALNRLKAQAMKAKLRKDPSASKLEAEYNAALAASTSGKESDVVVLGAMDNRMLAGSRKGEVKAVETKRGRERGLVEENEDMSIEDMVREERRTRGERGGEGRRFAERIAKDGKFTNDLDYLDENASKLAKRIHHSEINLKNTAISDFQKLNKVLDSCPLCHHEDTSTPPVAPVVSLATRTYLTLPTQPEVSPGGAVIVPIQHRTNLLECDEDEWEEIRNFMKSLFRLYHAQDRTVIFYENASHPHQRRHAAMVAVPLPPSLGETAPAFFRESILASDVEWSQHKKLIPTQGKNAFRHTLVKEMPYFHVWFSIDIGLGHVVEDSNHWPKGDLFAREVIGGMLDVEPDVIKRQGRWVRGGNKERVEGFRKAWAKWDWTSVLTDG